MLDVIPLRFGEGFFYVKIPQKMKKKQRYRSVSTISKPQFLSEISIENYGYIICEFDGMISGLGPSDGNASAHFFGS